MDLIDERVEAYCRAHTAKPHDIYERLRAATLAETAWPQMQVGHLEGRLLKMLAQLLGARRAVEVGTFTGYSALSIAEGLAEDGILWTLDVDDVTGRIAQEHFDQVPWGSRIRRVIGPATETIPLITEPLDLVFIDADKLGYLAYWEALVPRVRSGGLLIVDNTLWSGRVLSPEADSDHAIVAFNEHVARDTRVEPVMLTVRDGMTVCRKC